MKLLSGDREGNPLQALRRYKRVMLALAGVLLVLLGATMLWFRGPLASSIARLEQRQARAWPRFYPGTVGRVYTSERVWRDVFVPILGVAFLAVGLIWLWKGMGT